MHILQMTGLVMAIYFFSLGFIVFYRDKINIKIGNLIFVIADVFFFFLLNYCYFKNGALDSFMTFDNISPFTFTLIPLICLLKDKVKEYAFCAIAFLHFGMLCAVMVSPEQAYLFNFTAEADMLGIYLVLTRQVKPCFKSWLKSLLFMYSVITFGVLLNFAFHRSYFGMNPYGNYSIYFLDVFHNFGTTLFVYYLGVLVVLTFGMQTSYWFLKLLEPHGNKRKKKRKETTVPMIESDHTDVT